MDVIAIQHIEDYYNKPSYVLYVFWLPLFVSMFFYQCLSPLLPEPQYNIVLRITINRRMYCMFFGYPYSFLCFLPVSFPSFARAAIQHSIEDYYYKPLYVLYFFGYPYSFLCFLPVSFKFPSFARAASSVIHHHQIAIPSHRPKFSDNSSLYTTTARQVTVYRDHSLRLTVH
jgi:hypothetical protein